MRMQVSATRMQLLKLRKRLGVARRGHKLLKDKQEELMRQILGLVGEIGQHRARVEQDTGRVMGRLAVARNYEEPEVFDAALSVPTRRVSVEVATRNILNIKVPVFKKEVSGTTRCYGTAHTSPDLDATLAELDKLLDSLLVLAEKEKTLELLAEEMEKTRRRVNALEFVLIPDLEQTVKFIVLKLAEAERGELTRLMRVKEIIRK